MKKENEFKPKNETFAALKETLPFGYSRTIIARLAERGLKTSPSNVYSVVNGRSRNAEIEKEILKLLDEPQEPAKSEFETEIEKRLGSK